MSGFPIGPRIRVQILEIIKDGKIHTKDEVVEKLAKHFKLTKEQKLRKKLEEYFKPYNEKFYKLIGKNFGW